MLIRPLAVDDDDEMHAMYVVFREATRHQAEGMLPPEEAVIGQIREPGSGVEHEAWAGVDGEGPDARLVGGGMLFLPLTDNLDKAYLGLVVHPDFQRQGYGTRLAEHVIARAVDKGRTVLLGDGFASFAERDDNGPRRFAETLGFRAASTEVLRRLDLPVDDRRLGEWIDEAAPHHTDYRIQTFDRIPDELIASITHVHNQLALDAPTGEIDFEAQGETPEQLRERRERDARIGEVTLETVAIDTAGQVVAATTLHVHVDRSEPAHQGATLVLREHRGHRLGLAVKAANMRELQVRFPECRAIVTSNEEANANMVAINERLGFAARGLHVTFMRQI
jgi:GNAT superfamily N-acetyltransferase